MTPLQVGVVPNHGSRPAVLLRESHRKPAGAGDRFVVDLVNRQVVKVGTEFQEPALLQKLSETRMTVGLFTQDGCTTVTTMRDAVGKAGENRAGSLRARIKFSAGSRNWRQNLVSDLHFQRL